MVRSQWCSHNSKLWQWIFLKTLRNCRPIYSIYGTRRVNSSKGAWDFTYWLEQYFWAFGRPRKHMLACTMGFSIFHEVGEMGFLSPNPNCLENPSILRLFPKHLIKNNQINWYFKILMALCCLTRSLSSKFPKVPSQK